MPIVYTHLLNGDKEVVEEVEHAKFLAFGGYQKGAKNWRLVHPFDRSEIYWHEPNGRMYHPAKPRFSGVGLMKSQLAIDCFDQLGDISQESELSELVDRFSMLDKVIEEDADDPYSGYVEFKDRDFHDVTDPNKIIPDK